MLILACYALVAWGLTAAVAWGLRWMNQERIVIPTWACWIIVAATFVILSLLSLLLFVASIPWL